MAGMLSMVGTPIGNLGDVSPRVHQTLSQADLVLCEDTRVSAKLLAHLEVHVPLQRADENVLAQKLEGILQRIEAGERVAFVSDAGMPGVSDPGQLLVDAALDAGLAVEVVPGPSAAICALVASGMKMEHFFFEGFLPRKAGPQKARLQELAPIPGALILYESPRRVAVTLATIAEVFPKRRVALLRELTKIHEECVRGLAPEVAEVISRRGELRGECVIVIDAPTKDELARALAPELSLEEAIQAGLAQGEPKSALAKRLAKEYQRSKSEVYNAILNQ